MHGFAGYRLGEQMALPYSQNALCFKPVTEVYPLSYPLLPPGLLLAAIHPLSPGPRQTLVVDYSFTLCDDVSLWLVFFKELDATS